MQTRHAAKGSSLPQPTRRPVWFLAAAAGVIVALASGVFLPRHVRACGPFFTSPVFVLRHHPDFEPGQFAAGRLGLVQPTWARVYLFVAYRSLSAVPLSQDERGAVVNAGARAAPAVPAEPAADADAALARWLEARRTTEAGRGDPPDVHLYRAVRPGDYANFLNCTADALGTAAKTLEDRRARYGARSREMDDWLRAQDLVFANCGGGRAVPDSLPGSATLLARQDRAYQIAAAEFYATDFDAAERSFRAIAGETTSPWSSMAPYLAARCLIRKATLSAGPASVSQPLLERAAAELQAIRRDGRDERVRAAADRLLGFVLIRSDPVGRARDLATLLAGGKAGSDAGRALDDYRAILDRAHGERLFEGPDQRLTRARSAYERLGDLRATGDLSDWLITFQSAEPSAAAHAIDRWRETRSAAWLVAALDKATADTPGLDELMAAARAVEPGAPGYVTALFHRLRLGQAGGENAAVEAERVLAGAPDWPPSFANTLRALALPRARDLEQLAGLAVRVPAGAGGVEGERSLDGAQKAEGPRWRLAFDSDGAALLNTRLPLVLLERISASPHIGPALSGEVGRAVWTRAVLTGRDAVARRLVAFVERAAPGLKAELTTYRKAATPAERERAALFVLLKAPGLRPLVAPGLGRDTDPWGMSKQPLAGGDVSRLDQFRDNWWCDAGAFSGLSSYKEPAGEATKGAPWPTFMTAAERAEADREQAALAELPTAPVVLGERVVRWAKAAPDDPRVPEALYLAVRASHYGCWTPATTAASRAAFRLLHSRYPGTEWAKKTPYYY